MNFYLWLLIFIVTITPVWAANSYDDFELHGKKYPTKVSGYTGKWVDLVADDKYQALRGLQWGEKTDDPCGLYIATSHINNFSSPIVEFDMAARSVIRNLVFGDFKIIEDRSSPERAPGGGVKTDSSGNIKFAKHIDLDCGGNEKSAVLPNFDQYVYRLQVCTTDKRDTWDDKLKGVRIWSRSVRYKDYKPGETPILVDESTPHEDIHKPHCDKWHKPVQCAAGEIATGLRVHYSTKNHNPISGLALLCRKLQLKDTAELNETPIEAPSLQDRETLRQP